MRFVPLILALALSIYAVVDCIQTDESRVRGLPKLVWVVLILLFPVGGSAAWFIVGRPRKTGPTPPRNLPRGPDDDPDFLKGL